MQQGQVFVLKKQAVDGGRSGLTCTGPAVRVRDRCSEAASPPSVTRRKYSTGPRTSPPTERRRQYADAQGARRGTPRVTRRRTGDDRQLSWLLAKAFRTFGGRQLPEPRSQEIAAWAHLNQLAARLGETQLLFPSPHGGYFDLHNFRNRYWKPAQIAAGIVPLRRVDDLRHTFATFALRACISTFDLSRCMAASLTMFDRHYGHLARDGREHAIRLLDSYADIQAADVQGLDVGWTSQLPIVAGHDN
jgi:hypothetical protein